MSVSGLLVVRDMRIASFKMEDSTDKEISRYVHLLSSTFGCATVLKCDLIDLLQTVTLLLIF